MEAAEIIVIGGGAAGLMAAGRAAERGCRVLLLEKMPETGNKLRLTGNGRGNLSNSKPLAEFTARYGRKGRFLYGAFHQFFREELQDLMARYGVNTRVESDGRIFPVSSEARDIWQALHRYLAQGKARIMTGVKVDEIIGVNKKITGVRAGEQVYSCRAVVLAAGGASYPGTGSTGDGFRMAAALGHTIYKIRPASVPLVVEDTGLVKKLQGISLHDIRLSTYTCRAAEIDAGRPINADYGRGTSGKKPPLPVLESRRGSLIFTHFGISGPAVLPQSLAVGDTLAEGPVSAAVDLLPELDSKALNQELQGEIEANGKKLFRSSLRKWLPEKLAAVVLERSKIDKDIRNHQVTAGVREKTGSTLKAFRFDIKGTLPIETAMVTAGGVALEEIEPKTMASKLIKGLYLAGEVIDIDAETGGYNLQAAFSTGWAAGEGAAEYIKNS